MKCIEEILPVIHQRMTVLGLTQAALGKFLSLSQPNISRRLSGKTPFTVDELGKLEHLLGLQAGEEEPSAPPPLGQGLHLLQKSLTLLSEQDRREFLFVAALILEGKLREPAKSQLCESLRLLARGSLHEHHPHVSKPIARKHAGGVRSVG